MKKNKNNKASIIIECCDSIYNIQFLFSGTATAEIKETIKAKKGR
jgi:hypothetical protein